MWPVRVGLELAFREDGQGEGPRGVWLGELGLSTLPDALTWHTGLAL